MLKISTFLIVVLLVSACSKTRYYYLTNGPATLYQMPTTTSLVSAHINVGDTLISWKRMGKSSSRFVQVQTHSGSGYVRSTGHPFLYSAKADLNRPLAALQETKGVKPPKAGALKEKSAL